MLKRLISRDSNNSEAQSDGPAFSRPQLMRSTSYIPNSSLPPPPKPAGGSMRITDQVIEEVDEQLTISQMTQSRKGDPLNRPNIQDVFPAPIDVKDNAVPAPIDVKDNAVQKGGPGNIYLRSYSSVSGGLASPLESPNINEFVSIGKDDMSRATGKNICFW